MREILVTVLRRKYRTHRAFGRDDLQNLLSREEVASLIFWGEVEHRLGVVWLRRKTEQLQLAVISLIQRLWR
jgi:DUF1009 family protein